MTTIHANHTIREFTNANGVTKFEVTRIGETKPRGQFLKIERAMQIAGHFA